MKLIGTFSCVLICAGANPNALAGDFDLGDRVPSESEVVEMLAPSPDRAFSRGIRLQAAVQPRQADAETGAASAISLQVRFGYGSDRLTPEARRQLLPVARAMASDRLASVRFTVEGHTDASGGEDYNQTLSERRAEAVRRFLVGHRVEPARIMALGRGETMPLDTGNPYNPENRRVRIVASYD
jgi:outer membrane protein OmpA-like peptidoglycan-associated protein